MQIHLQRTARAVGWSMVIGTLAGGVAGIAGAFFVHALAAATAWRDAHPATILLLPLWGFALGVMLDAVGSDAVRGMQRVWEALQGDGPPLPWAMGPVIFVAATITHLGGGSAGREGAAVQMGAALANALIGHFDSSPAARARSIIAGMAGGFAAVFGTPLAATCFALEMARGRARGATTVVAGGVAACVGQRVAVGLGVLHGAFVPPTALDWPRWPSPAWLVLAVVIALVAAVFVHGTEHLKQLTAMSGLSRPVRMAVGGALVVVLWQWFDGGIYLGLGDSTIARAFIDPRLPPASFFIKALITAVTLGFGFLGGEVTPLFFIGATLGNALAGPLSIPLGVAAAAGLAGMFAAAAKMPLSLAVMAAELFGPAAFVPCLSIHVLACALRWRGPGLYDTAAGPAGRGAR